MSKLYKKTDGYNDATIDVVPKPTNRLGIASLVLGVVAIAVSISAAMGLLGKNERVGIVRTQEILEKYQGALDARASFTGRASAMQRNLDTLRRELERMATDYEGKKGTMTSSEREARESALRLKETQVRDYGSAIEEKAGAEQRTLTETIVRHVKNAADQIGRERGYGLILAVSDDGLIIHHDEAVDLTDEVLSLMKQSYRGELREGPR